MTFQVIRGQDQGQEMTSVLFRDYFCLLFLFLLLFDKFVTNVSCALVLFGVPRLRVTTRGQKTAKHIGLRQVYISM